MATPTFFGTLGTDRYPYSLSIEIVPFHPNRADCAGPVDSRLYKREAGCVVRFVSVPSPGDDKMPEGGSRFPRMCAARAV